MSDSGTSENAKESARKNIAQAIFAASASPPPQKSAVTTVAPPSSPPLKSDPSPDDVAQGNKMRVLNAVKALQAEMKREPSPQQTAPMAKPRKSPVNSPSNSRSSSPAHPNPKVAPPRPPPPKPPPRLQQNLDLDPQPLTSVSPPSSPMRRRSLDMKTDKPKPPTRRRRKFQTPEHIVEEPDNPEDLLQPVQPVQSAEQVQQDTEVATNGPTQSSNQNAESSRPREDSTWEVIPGIKISEDDLKKPLQHVGPDHGDEATPTQDDDTPPVTDHTPSKSEGEFTNEHFEDAVRALSFKKKKPPPIRPPPFQEKNPPLPPKKRKSVIQKTGSQQEEEPVGGGVGGSEDGEGVKKEGRIEHLYEVIDRNDLRSRPENLATPIDKHPSANSLTSEDSGGSESVSRSSTVGAAERIMLRGGRGSAKTRPQSEVSNSSIEASFEVIPQRGTNINDVMSTLRKADEKYQDASIYELVQACSRAMPHVTSTSELPPRIPDFPSEGRLHSIHELYTTEYTYVKGLEVLVDVFKVNLAPVMGEEASHVFANVENILAFNKGFIALLHSRLMEWKADSCVGDLFIGMFTQSHKSMYAIYCSNYDTAEALVSKLKKRKDFEQQLQVCLSNTRVLPGLTLSAYLITPIQRVTRYILLIKDTIKRTPEDHPDYRNLTKALDTMDELAHYIDAQVSEAQTKKTLQTLKNKVHGLADLDSPARSLVKDGQVYLKSIKKLYQCILFNDLLVFAHGDSRQSRVELQLNLEAVWVEDLEDLDPQTSNEDAVEVYTPGRPYTIYTQTRNEKRLWLSKLRETIYHHLLSKDRISPSSDFKTEGRFADFVYTSGMIYTGNFVDAKRHGRGTMSWPNKSCYVGEWVDDERCGEGEFTFNTGDVYRGRWLEDKQNGMGELQYTTNDIYRGHWKDGIRHGDGKILYANGDVFEGHFVHGHIEGKGSLKCNNGVEYNGDWKHSQRHGSGRLRTATGKLYKGEFSSNQIQGTGTMVYPNRDKYEGRWKNGMRHGHGKFTSTSEGVYEGSWEEDLRHGKGRQVYPNGDVYEGQWEHNKHHAHGKMTYSDGRSYDGEFCNDLISGEGLMNYSKHSKYHGSWMNGLRHGSGSMVYEDKSSYTGDWVMGLRHGQGEVVMADGSVYRGQWVNDKPHGKGTLSISTSEYSYNGDWVSGMRDGRGEEKSEQYGSYKGAWKGDTKTGYGEERTMVGTVFEGTWDRNRKHGRGVRKMIFGSVDEQFWKAGQLQSDLERMTAVELPFLNRTDV